MPSLFRGGALAAMEEEAHRQTLHAPARVPARSVAHPLQVCGRLTPPRGPHAFLPPPPRCRSRSVGGAWGGGPPSTVMDDSDGCGDDRRHVGSRWTAVFTTGCMPVNRGYTAGARRSRGTTLWSSMATCLLRVLLGAPAAAGPPLSRLPGRGGDPRLEMERPLPQPPPPVPLARVLSVAGSPEACSVHA